MEVKNMPLEAVSLFCSKNILLGRVKVSIFIFIFWSKRNGHLKDLLHNLTIINQNYVRIVQNMYTQEH